MTNLSPGLSDERRDREKVRVLEGGQGLVVTRIGKSFRRRPVVRSVSLTLRRGEVVGLDDMLLHDHGPRARGLRHDRARWP
jgi:hypothetical protein